MLVLNERLNSKQEVVQWETHPITRLFFEHINKEISDLQESLLSGSTLGIGTDSSSAVVVANTAKTIGATNALKYTLNKIINDMKESEENDG